MIDDQIKALGRLGRTKTGRKIIADHRDALLSILASAAAREASAGRRAPRRRARQHKVDPETGFCGGCDDALGIDS